MRATRLARGTVRAILMEPVIIFRYTLSRVQLSEFSSTRSREGSMFTQEVLNGFQMATRTAACELPASRQGCRAFVGVYPPLPEKGVNHWRVRRFEIPTELVDQYFGEEQLINSQLVQMNTIEQVEELLATWNVDSAALQAPWKSDYPL